MLELIQPSVEVNCPVKVNYRKISNQFRHTYVNNNLYILSEFSNSSDHNIGYDFFYSDDSILLNTQKNLWQNKSPTPQYYGAASANNTLLLHISESPESNEKFLVYTFDPQSNSWSLPAIVEFLTGIINYNGKLHFWGGININSELYEKLHMLNYNNIGNDFFYLDVLVALNNQRLLCQDFNTIPKDSNAVYAKDYVKNTLFLYIAEYQSTSNLDGDIISIRDGNSSQTELLSSRQLTGNYNMIL
jgi:hypothetical protein